MRILHRGNPERQFKDTAQRHPLYEVSAKLYQKEGKDAPDKQADQYKVPAQKDPCLGSDMFLFTILFFVFPSNVRFLASLVVHVVLTLH